MKTMTFSTALELIKLGFEVSRVQWANRFDKGYDVVQPSVSLNAKPYQIEKPSQNIYRTSGLFIHRRDTDGNYRPWTPGQEDLLAEDWYLFAAAEEEPEEQCDSTPKIHRSLSEEPVAGPSLRNTGPRLRNAEPVAEPQPTEDDDEDDRPQNKMPEGFTF